MHSVKASYKYSVTVVVLLLAATCSVEKNTGASRFYQGMTSKYNIYFNGYESFKAGLQKISSNYTDDYGEILKVFEYSDPSTAKLCYSDMETAIQKASKVISLKSITAKPEIRETGKPVTREGDLTERKEYNHWVDDSYLLIAKSRFYKHEFKEALALFDYSIAQANDPIIRMEASVWLARIYNETGMYSDSYRVLTELEIGPGSSKSLRSMYYTTLADLFIKQKKYSEATDPLTSAIQLVSGKHLKYRLTYLLAQLNERSGNTDRAISLYRDVVKMNPPYDVEFNARINIAGLFDIKSGNTVNIERELEKMLKDSKNKEFLDQIYYALGNLSLKEGKESEALNNFRKSASSPSLNINQKGRSYLALADYYFKKDDFLNAGKYYDSTVFFLNNKNPDFSQLQSRSRNLNSVVSQLKIIQYEDSLQKVASMSESERKALVSTIIAEVTKAEAEGRPSEYSDRYNMGQYYENERRFQGNIDQEGKWYFYNQAALTFGRTEFRRRWGDRKLEDNWNRSNKARISTSQTAANGEDAGQKTADSAKAVPDYRNPEFYLRNLPLTDSLKEVSNEKIANAYLNAGKAYSEKIGDPVRATESFEKLISRFPDNELVPEALYNLYRTNNEVNSIKAEAYRQRLLEKYPSTEFARILSDPAYFEKKLAGMKMAETLYQQAYNYYTSENFSTAISLCDNGMITYSSDPLASRFMLLRAYCIARISDERAFKEELTKIIKQWPETSESRKASDLIAYLNQKLPELKVEEDKEIAKELFVADTAKTTIFTLIISDPTFNINQATFDVISYNIDNYTNKNYRTEGTLIDNKYITINVSGFANYATAMGYYKSFAIDRIIRNPQSIAMSSFLISTDNMNALAKDKNPERYRLFFLDNYLNEKN